MHQPYQLATMGPQEKRVSKKEESAFGLVCCSCAAWTALLKYDCFVCQGLLARGGLYEVSNGPADIMHTYPDK